MMIKAPFLTLLLLLFLQGSCAGPSGKKTSLPENLDYSPKRVFDLDFPTAWESTLQGLEGKRIPVILRDRERGIIRTDYQPGPDTQLLGKVVSSRFKYSIFFLRKEEKKTIVNLRCLYEINTLDGKSFTDASSIFPDKVAALEREFYQTIESFLLPKEAAPPASSGTGEEKAATPAGQNHASPPSMAEVQTDPLNSKEPPPDLSASASQAYAELPAPSAPPKDAQLASPPPAEEITPIAPRVEPKARVLGYEPIFLITKKNTPLREKPSNQSKIVETLKKGRKVEKIGESGNWVKVKIWETTIGWTPKDLLQEIP